MASLSKNVPLGSSRGVTWRGNGAVSLAAHLTACGFPALSESRPEAANCGGFQIECPKITGLQNTADQDLKKPFIKVLGPKSIALEYNAKNEKETDAGIYESTVIYGFYHDFFFRSSHTKADVSIPSTITAQLKRDIP